MQIVEFWSRCDPDARPCVHPDDRQIIQGLQPAPVDIGGFDAFIHHDQFGARNHQLHLSLLPLPYEGRLRTADIFILALNPRFKPCDYYAEGCVREYRERRVANLRQDLDGLEFPFMSLDPRFSWTYAFDYWESRLHKIAQTLATERHEGCYTKALSELAGRIAVIELAAYASFFDPHVAEALPSRQKVLAFARECIFRAAEDRTALVLIRSAGWYVGHPPPRCVRLNWPGWLTPSAPGGRAILDWLHEHRESRCPLESCRR